MIRGTKRNIIPKKIEASLDASIHNRFDIEVIDSVTGAVKQKAYAENIVLNQLWTYIGNNSWFAYIHYGTGSGTPSATRTGLFTYLSAKAAVDYERKFVNGHTFMTKKKITISETENIGQTLTEIGIGFTAATDKLMTHAMLKDMNGNQISIAKTSTDIINIYATVFVHWGENTDIVFINKNHIWLDVLTGATNMYQFAPVLVLQKNSIMGGDNGYPYPAIGLSVVPAEKKIKGAVTRLGANTGNIVAMNRGVMASYYNNSYYNFLMFFPCYASWFAGSNVTGEAVATGDGVIKDFQTAFSLVSAAKIYVNGVEQTTGVTIDENYPLTQTLAIGLFQLINPVNGGVDGFFPYCHDHWSSYSDTNGLVGVAQYNLTGDPKATYYRNIYHETIGITQFTRSNSGFTHMYMSNDCINWVQVDFAAIASEYQHYEFIKVAYDSRPSDSERVTPTLTRTTDKNIHFDVAPTSGAVITADYHTQNIAKDANHVFDFSFEIQLGEYIG